MGFWNFFPYFNEILKPFRHQTWYFWVKFWKKFACGAIFRKCSWFSEKKWPKNAIKTQNIGYIGCFSAPKASKIFFDPLSTRYNGVLKIQPYFGFSLKKPWCKHHRFVKGFVFLKSVFSGIKLYVRFAKQT